jgi:AcrR family transcriptional regulator
VAVSEVQRARMLSSAAQVIAQHGYSKMSVSRVTVGARVSRRTFYDLFEDREDCFLAVFDRAIEDLAVDVVGAYDGEERWEARVRAGLEVLLERLDARQELGELLFVQALRAGARVLARRAEVLSSLAGALDEGARRGAGAPRVVKPPPLAGEGVVGAVSSVLHARVTREAPGRLSDLLNPLMATIVLPYRGRAAAERELDGTTTLSRGRTKSHGAGDETRRQDRPGAPGGDPLAELPMRITYRTLRALSVVGERPGASNRAVGDGADIYDQGQTSKLLARLEKLGLIRNTAKQGHRPTGEANAWRLTDLGERIARQLALGTDAAKDADHAR